MVSLPAPTSWQKKLAKSTSDIRRPSKSSASRTSVTSPRGCDARRSAANCIAYAASSMMECRSASSVGDVGVLAGEHLLGDAVHVRPVRSGKSHEPAHDPGRQLGAHVVHELDLRPELAGLGHDVAAQFADLLLELADSARLEARDHRLAVVRVARRIHRDEHVARHREAFRRRVLEHDAALARREQVRLVRDVQHVGMGEHGVEARLAVHVLPHHGLGAPQLGEKLVRRPVGKRVGIRQARGGMHQAVSDPPAPFSRTSERSAGPGACDGRLLPFG